MLVWKHEIIGDLIGGSLAVLHLYEKDDDFGSKDGRNDSHRSCKRLREGRLVSRLQPWPIFIA